MECGVPVFGEADDYGNYNKADELSCLSDLLKNYDVLVDAFYLVYVAQHAVQNGAAAYLKQRLGKILRERIKTGGIAGCYHNGFHRDGL